MILNGFMDLLTCLLEKFLYKSAILTTYQKLTIFCLIDVGLTMVVAKEGSSHCFQKGRNEGHTHRKIAHQTMNLPPANFG